MKFACPVIQKRELLKCGSIASGSALASLGGLGGSSALAAGLPPLGEGASGCCAYAGIIHVAATVSHKTASSVLAVQRIDLQFRFPIFAHGLTYQSPLSWLKERYRCDPSWDASSPWLDHICARFFFPVPTRFGPHPG